MWHCARFGYKYRVERGSYEGQERKQLDYLAVIVTEPRTRPLAVSLPEQLPFPSPTSEKRIENYFLRYLMSEEIADNQDYTYGYYIAKQVDKIIDILNTGNSNQACITIGDIASVHQHYPPCLKVIDFKVVDGKLDMSLYFRSWDLFAGMPENLGGLQMLKEYLLMNLDKIYGDGKIIAYSSGAHIYEQYYPLVDQLNIHKC